MKTTEKKFNDASGMSLIELLVAVGLFGGVILIASTLLRNYIATTDFAKVAGQVLDLRNYVRNSMDCTKTFANPATSSSCSSGGSGVVDILDHNGAVLVSKTSGSTVISQFKLRTHCTDEGGSFGLWVDYIPINSSGEPRVDPLTSKIADWRSLSSDIPTLCQPAAAPPPVSCTAPGTLFLNACWYLSSGSTTSCDSVCASHGGAVPTTLTRSECLTYLAKVSISYFTGADVPGGNGNNCGHQNCGKTCSQLTYTNGAGPPNYAASGYSISGRACKCAK